MILPCTAHVKVALCIASNFKSVETFPQPVPGILIV
eukprot:COSAG02_NODE_59073_length_275_cov_0.840909_1_plen_35_part_01